MALNWQKNPTVKQNFVNIVGFGDTMEVNTLTENNICSNCNHPKDKHAFDMVVTDRKNPCELSCTICFDLETERLKRIER